MIQVKYPTLGHKIQSQIIVFNDACSACTHVDDLVHVDGRVPTPLERRRFSSMYLVAR